MPAATASPPWLDGRPTIEHVAAGPVWRPGGDGVVRFIRFDAGMGSTYGIVEGEVVHAINGNLFSPGARTGWVHPMAAVQVLSPLGPIEFGQALWLGTKSGPDGGIARPLRHIGPNDLLGPGAELPVVSPSGVVRPVVGLVVGGTVGYASLFGLTAGFLSAGPTSIPRLALGPSVAHGLDAEGLRIESGAGESAIHVTRFGDHGAAGLSRARALLARGSVATGDVLLVPISDGIRHPDSGDITVYNRIPEVGELRCALRSVVPQER